MKRMLMIVGLAAACAAETAAQNNVGVIDIARIFKAYERTAYLEEEFVAKEKFLNEEAEKKRAQIESSRRALQEAFKPNTPEYDRKVAELQEAEIRYRVWTQMETEAIKTAHKRSLMEIYADVRAGVQKVAEERGVDLVVTYDLLTQDAPDSAALRQQILLQKVIYWSPSLDLTDPVIKVINDAFRLRNTPAAPRESKPAADKPTGEKTGGPAPAKPKSP